MVAARRLQRPIFVAGAVFRGRPQNGLGWAGLAGLAGLGWLGLQRGRLQRAEIFRALRPRPASCGAAANEWDLLSVALVHGHVEPLLEHLAPLGGAPELLSSRKPTSTSTKQRKLRSYDIQLRRPCRGQEAASVTRWGTETFFYIDHIDILTIVSFYDLSILLVLFESALAVEINKVQLL